MKIIYLDEKCHTCSEYIRRSIDNMNKVLYEQERKVRLTKISKRIREESMIINSEFSKVEYDPKT